ncbi:thiamine pyrophosphate-dependent dehydrogenase E1 component subunit alpha [Prochlorococcus sp. AH-736-M13]|nr:thiamine pyrophosphate-dependent dehydrogenase E1 component subunit alpha [Prochlorococcus sp. AH-736-M13]MDA9746849.1 thiamine pyrophosphate-dependent dehydrogenase E1 component subunit alpha [Prochlorococcus sp. AH-736-M13]
MSILNKVQLFHIFEKAYFIRSVEECIAKNYSKSMMRCPTHLSIGQELVPSILSLFHDNNDLAVSTHRAHGHYLGKGGSLQRLFDELHGLNSGCSAGNGGSMHLIDESVGFYGSTAIVGNTIPVGVGMANSFSIERKKNLVYIFLGDAATEEGVFYESLHYASLNSLPCIFVVENNNFSVYTDIKTRQNSSLKEKTISFNVNYFLNKDHDYENLYEIFEESSQIAKSFLGPVLIEVMTHRYREHCGPNYDDELNYRDERFLEYWRKRDIIRIIEDSLFKLSVSRSDIGALKERIDLYVESEYLQSEEKAKLEFCK